MRTRYIAAVSWDPAARGRVADRLCRHRGMNQVFERGPLLLFAGAGAGERQQIGIDGMLLGRLFDRARGGPLMLGEDDQQAILNSRGKWLIDRAWGGYVMLLISSDGSKVSILRAPLGDLPCYWWRSEGTMLLGSDINIMEAAGMPAPGLDCAALARHLAAEDLRRAETCLSGVQELPGGERIDVCDRGVERHALWSPWPFAAPREQVADPALAISTVRSAALQSVSCHACGFDRIVLKLSGGLDSSIVAACLARAHVDVTCVNLVTARPAGDEREHARAVASWLALPIVERLRDVSMVDVATSLAARLPRPTARAFAQESARIAGEIATETGSGALFDGGGGDNLFCSLQSARPVTDCLQDPQGRRWALPTARTVAALAQASLFAVIRRSFGIALRRTTAYRWTLDTRFMSADAAHTAASKMHHPWLQPPDDVLPGKVAHVALIAAAQSVVEGFDVEDSLPTYSPLICQLLAEACLRVPSWLWFDNGNNRAAARRAFDTLLPARTVQRRSKGAPDCFIADIYDARRGQIRELLLGGILDQQKLIDAEAIATVLNDDAPVQGHDFLRIMHLVDAEAWARCRWRHR